MSSNVEYKCDICKNDKLHSGDVVEGPVIISLGFSNAPVHKYIHAGNKNQHICDQCRHDIEEAFQRVSHKFGSLDVREYEATNADRLNQRYQNRQQSD